MTTSRTGEPTHPTRDPQQTFDDTQSRSGRKEKGGFRFGRLFGWLILLGVAAGASYGGWRYFQQGMRKPYVGPVWEVKRQPVQHTIVERGALESAENSDIVCRVKAGSKSGGTATTIKWVIENGSQVAKGELLVELDDSGLQEQLKDQLIKVNNARAAWVSAEQEYLIDESQNNSDIESAKVEKDLAVIDLRKFLGQGPANKVLGIAAQAELQKYIRMVFLKDAQTESGSSKSLSEFLQQMNDLDGKIEEAKSNKEQWADRSAWSQRMSKKGLIGRSQAIADQAKLDSAELSLRKLQGELDILKNLQLERTATDLWGKVKEAERKLDRVKTQAKSKEVKADAERKNKRAIFDQEDDRRQDIENEIRKCRVYSPQQGMVVYYIPEQSRFGGGSSQAIISQGEPVKEGQKMMSIPNLEKMLVNARVHEAMVSKLRGERSRPTGFTEALKFAGTLGKNPFEIAINGYAHNEVRDQFKDKDFEVTYPGQRAKIRVEAYNTKTFEGHVKSVATVASQMDFLSSDVKMYQTMISIDGTVDNLKPGMSAEVTIFASDDSEEVLVVPIQAVLGNLMMGADRKVFVLDAGGFPELKDVKVGRSNDKVVEVISGLEEGQKVVLNPRPLVSEQSDLRPGVPSGRGAYSEDGGKSGKKGFGKSGDPTKGKGAGGFNGGPPGGAGFGGGEGKKWQGKGGGIPGGGGLPPANKEKS